MIKSITLKFGPAPSANPLQLDTPEMVVIVGPNNSGKSKLLREIRHCCVSQNPNERTGFQILNSVEFEPVTKEQALRDLDEMTIQPLATDRLSKEERFVNTGSDDRHKINVHNYLSARTAPDEYNASVFVNSYARWRVLQLGGQARLDLLNPKSRELNNPTNSLSRLFLNDEMREKLRKKIFDAFGIYIGISAAEVQNFEVRFGKTPPPNERSLEQPTLNWLHSAMRIHDLSEGIRAYSGTLLELATGDPKLILIDEPEAFLHPTLSFRLGSEIGQLVRSNDKQVFVSTHSTQFLLGAIQSGVNLQIVRLTFDNETGTARALSAGDLATLTSDIIARTANAIDGIFYHNVVLTEGDIDKTLYQEINERLIQHDERSGVSDGIFINCIGKDNIHKIAAPLRRLGVPTSLIFDVDVLSNKTTSWQLILRACSIPPAMHESLTKQRAQVWKAMTDKNEDPKLHGGLDLLSMQDREAADHLVATLKEYGVFIVENGEVEDWLPNLGVARHSQKSFWLLKVLEKLGSNPEEPHYVKPSEGDVWKFLDDVSTWHNNPARRGIP